MLSVSWNVLADRFLFDGSHGDYSYVDPRLMRPGARLPRTLRVIEELRTGGVKIIALQEVELHLVQAIAATRKWRWYWSTKVDRSVGQLLLVAPEIPTGGYDEWPGQAAQRVIVGRVSFVNAHIRWARADSKDHRGLNQTRRILHHLGDGPAAILTDSNDRPGGPVRARLAKAGFTNVDDTEPTAYVKGMSESMDLIAGRGIHVRTLATRFSPRRIPTTGCPSDHIPVVAELTW
jgi:hypothetical protein